MSCLGKCNKGLFSGLPVHQHGMATMEEVVLKLQHRVHVLERSLKSETKHSQDLHIEVCQKTYCLEQLGKYASVIACMLLYLEAEADEFHCNSSKLSQYEQVHAESSSTHLPLTSVTSLQSEAI